MVHFTKALGVALSSAAVLVSAKPVAAPAPTPAASLKEARALHKRDSCTFTGSDADAASKSAGDCATVVISAMTVPSGTTLDLSDLSDGSSVSALVPELSAALLMTIRSSSRVPPPGSTRSGPVLSSRSREPTSPSLVLAETSLTETELNGVSRTRGPAATQYLTIFQGMVRDPTEVLPSQSSSTPTA